MVEQLGITGQSGRICSAASHLKEGRYAEARAQYERAYPVLLRAEDLNVVEFPTKQA